VEEEKSEKGERKMSIIDRMVLEGENDDGEEEE
jgi:hypothetical protein